jgi:hypothetical protein
MKSATAATRTAKDFVRKRYRHASTKRNDRVGHPTLREGVCRAKHEDKGGWLSRLEHLDHTGSAMKAEVRQSKALLHFRQSHAHETAHEIIFVGERSGG